MPGKYHTSGKVLHQESQTQEIPVFLTSMSWSRNRLSGSCWNSSFSFCWFPLKGYEQHKKSGWLSRTDSQTETEDNNMNYIHYGTQETQTMGNATVRKIYPPVPFL